MHGDGAASAKALRNVRRSSHASLCVPIICTAFAAIAADAATAPAATAIISSSSGLRAGTTAAAASIASGLNIAVTSFLIPDILLLIILLFLSRAWHQIVIYLKHFVHYMFPHLSIRPTEAVNVCACLASSIRCKDVSRAATVASIMGRVRIATMTYKRKEREGHNTSYCPLCNPAQFMHSPPSPFEPSPVGVEQSVASCAGLLYAPPPPPPVGLPLSSTHSIAKEVPKIKECLLTTLLCQFDLRLTCYNIRQCSGR